ARDPTDDQSEAPRWCHAGQYRVDHGVVWRAVFGGSEPKWGVLTGPSRPADTAGTSTKQAVRSRGGIMSLFRALGQPFLARADHPAVPAAGVWLLIPDRRSGSSACISLEPHREISASSEVEEGQRESWTCAPVMC